jgi:hypothetical protein
LFYRVQGEGGVASGQHDNEPEDIVKHKAGLTILREIKGGEFDMDHAKYQAARKVLLFKDEIDRSQQTKAGPKKIEPQGLIHIENGKRDKD